MSKFGDELVQSARQALEFAKGEAESGAFRVTVPTEIDVKAVRAKLNSPAPNSRDASGSQSAPSRTGSKVAALRTERPACC